MPSLPRPPASLMNALRLLVLCVGIEILGFAFSGGYSLGSVLGVVVGTLCVYGLLRLVHRGVNWARLVLAGVISLGLISSLSAFSLAYRQHPGATVIDLISTLISLIALVGLFSKQSNGWFRSHRTTGLKRS